METNYLSSPVKRHFGFLIKDYGFSIVHERYDPDMMGNAQVIFESTLIGIDIALDRSQVLIAIGSLAKPRREWFEFSDVLHYFAPDLTAYIFPNVPTDFPNHEASVDAQVSRLAKLMSQYCAPILNGDLSIANKVKEIENKRVSEMLEGFQRRKP